MKNVTIVQNPLVTNALSILRDRDTSLETFRFYSDQLCSVLLGEALQPLELEQVTIQTPVTQTTVKKLHTEDIVVIPILRAGIAMLTSALSLLPKASIGFVGLERNEQTAIAREYYCKLPKMHEKSTVIVIDPMLATGGSILHLLQRLQNISLKEVRVVSVIAAPEGIEAVHTAYPAVQIVTAAVDERLNEKKYIVPGLGDYGDRYFGTES